MLAIPMLLGTAAAQTLQLQYTFEDGPGTTTTSSGALPITLNMLSSSSSAVDLHGPAGSGVQNQGASLNLSTNPIAGNLGGAFAMVQNSSALGALGIISNFTATIWMKMPIIETNMNNQGSRIYGLMGTGLTDFGGVNSIGFQPQLANVVGTPLSPKISMRGVVGNTFINPAIYYDAPTNVWLFFALTYDSVSGNACMYYGTEASPAKMYMVRNIGAGTNFNFSGTPSFSLGDRPSKGRSFPGWIDDARFYTGSADINSIENIRKSSTLVLITGLVPDGSLLQSGTNTLSFTATSPNGVNASGIKVAVNGADVSSSLTFTPAAGGQVVTYTNLPVNPTLIQQSYLDGVNVRILVTDIGGIVTSNSYVYDAFSQNNFSFEAEDYDFNGGMFIDNPVYSFVGPDLNTYYQQTNGYVNVTDANDNGGGTLRLYRDPGQNVETEYSIGGGGPTAGGQNLGELMRQKVLNAYTVTNIARDVNVGFFDGGTIGTGIPNWMNYTRTFPSGTYNAYVRVADGAGALSSTLAQVTSGFGTPSQTTTNLGTFNVVNSGGWDNFVYVPLRDGSGNLIRVTLSGVNTLRLTAGSPASPNDGGGNVNFLMLTPANTNLPVISNINPNGPFQPTNSFIFTASSPGGFTINPASISVRFTIKTLLGQTTVTNLTTANGLVVTGTSTSRNVSTPLTTNLVYTAVINVTDVNGSPASSTVSFDTLSPNYVWEAEDFDYNDGTTSGLFIDNPQTNAYLNLASVEGVDGHAANFPGGQNAYGRGVLNTEVNGDAPVRAPYNGTGFIDYDLGWNDGGNWANYTRTYPAGSYNVYMRGAGNTAGGSATVSLVTSGLGTPTQTTTNLGTFTIPATGGWQTYTWVPMRDVGGNLVKFTSTGAVKTLRVTSGGGYNVNFYAFFPANTNLPALNNVYPDGTIMFQATNKLTFSVASAAGVTANNITVTTNGVAVTNLVFSGSTLNWNVSFTGLLPNTTYTVTLSATDVNGNNISTTKTFDTFSPANYTWEAEDFDYNDGVNSGLFIDNPQTNLYAGLSAGVDIDTHQVNFGGAYLYRPIGMDTEANGDVKRTQYLGAGNTNLDYTAGYFSGGAWMNYTRHYPAGSYNVYGRLADGATATTSIVDLSQVTSGWGTTTQTTNFLGTFTVPATGWESYNFIPLRDGSGNLVTLTFNGSTNTLKVAMDAATGADCNVNFLMLVPASSGLITLTATISGGNINISFPTQNGSSYQLLYKNDLTDPTWTPIGSPVSGNGSVQSLGDTLGLSKRFYRVQVQ